MKKNSLTKSKAIAAVAEKLQEPVSLEVFTQRVLELWPSKAKNPQAAIRRTINYDALGNTLLFQDETRLIPIRLGMQDVRFRVPLTEQEIQSGQFFINLAFQFFSKNSIPPEEYHLEDAKGREIPTRVIRTKGIAETLYGSYDQEDKFFDIAAWYRAQNATQKDSVIVTILDWDTARYRFVLEKHDEREQHLTEIEKQNQAIADYLFDMLENQKNEYLIDRIGISHAYYKLKQEAQIAPDHWYLIIEQDPRMMLGFADICYSDWEAPIADFARQMAGIPHPYKDAQLKPVDKQQAAQVYQFKAALKRNKRLWRRVEIQGGQTLGDLDSILKLAFKHDSWDHLSGFWKLIRRGETHRFREVDLGTINPFEGGGAEEIQIASLELTMDDKLKYVYDFGDWIEHHLKPESIHPPEKNTRYPRITGQNKPKFKPCISCLEEGKEITATWICFTCSYQEMKNILVCESCADKYHGDHYIDEILY